MQCWEDAGVEPTLDSDADPDPTTTEGTDLPPPDVS
jgi:hypothetical protein